MHCPGTSDVEHTSVHIRFVVARGSEWNNHLIEFETFREVHRCNDYAIRKSRTIRSQQVNTMSFDFLEKTFRLIQRLANNSQ